MRILLVGNPNSVWTINFIDNVIDKTGAEVCMIANCAVQKKFQSYYKAKNINFLLSVKAIKRYTEEASRRHCPWLYDKMVDREVIKALGNLEPFDIINLHYVSLRELHLLSKAKKDNEKLVLSYYGSDLLRARQFRLWRQKKYVEKADIVTFDNVDLQKVFHKIYGKSCGRTKQYLLRFGLPVLDFIKEMKCTVDNKQAKQKLGISDSDITIAVGYNGKKVQQHLDVLHEITQIEEKLKKKITIILQMTYGGTNRYKELVKKMAVQSGCNVIVFEDYLSDEEVAIIRLATDIYINSQKTDAFSGSVCENLYAGCTLLNADWLTYEEFKKDNFQFVSFKKFSELSSLITHIIEGKVTIDTQENERLIWKLRSWDMCGARWLKALK